MSFPINLTILSSSGQSPSSEVYFGAYSGGYNLIISANSLIKVGLNKYRITLYARSYQSYSNLKITCQGISYSGIQTPAGGNYSKLTYVVTIKNYDLNSGQLSLALFNSSNYGFYLLTQNCGITPYLPKLYLESDSFLTYPKSDTIRSFSFGNDFYSFNFNYASGLGLFSKSLFDGLLPIKLSLHIDPRNLLYRLSVEQHLDITNHILFNGKLRNTYFIESSTNSNYFIDKEGSGLVLEIDSDYASSGTYYKIHHVLDNIKKEIFDSNGNLVAFTDSHGNINLVSRSGSNITITDYRGNVITYTFQTYGSGVAYDIKLNNVLFYRIADVTYNSQREFDFYEFKDGSVFKSIIFKTQGQDYIKFVQCNGERLELTFNYVKEKYNELTFLPVGSGEIPYEQLSLSYDESLNKTTITNYKNVVYEYLFDVDHKLLGQYEYKDGTSRLLFSKQDSDYAFIERTLTTRAGDIVNIGRNNFKPIVEETDMGAFIVETNHINPNGSYGPETIFSFPTVQNNNDPFIIGLGKHVAFKFYLSSETNCVIDETSYILLIATFQKYNSTDTFTQRIKFFKDESLSSGGVYYYTADLIISTLDTEIYDDLDITIEVYNLDAKFILRKFMAERIRNFEQLCYEDDHDDFHIINTHECVIEYKPQGSNSSSSIIESFSQEDLLVNHILSLRGEQTLFYNGLKGAIHNFTEAKYWFKPEENYDISVDNFTFVIKKVEKGKIKYLYLKKEIINSVPYITSFVDNSFGTHISYTRYRLNEFLPIKVLSELGLETTYSYNSGSNYLSSESNNLNQSVSYNYNSNKTLSSRVDTESGTTSFTYSNDLDLVTSIIHDNIATTYTYSGSTTYNYLSSFSKSNSTNHINYSSSSVYNISSFTNTSNVGFSFGYDIYRKVKQIFLGGSLLLQIIRNITDTVDTKTVYYANNHNFTETYDEYGRLINKKEGSTTKIENIYLTRYYNKTTPDYTASPVYSGSVLRYVHDYYVNESTKIDYDDDLKVIGIKKYNQIVDFNGTTPSAYYSRQITYDSLDRISQDRINVNNGTNSISTEYIRNYEYYQDTSLITYLKITHYQYGNQNCIEDYITYDALQRISAYNIKVAANYYQRNYTYLASSISISTTFSNSQSTLSETLTKDNRGNILSQTKTGLINETISYEYDNNDRLTKETIGGKEIRYTYDNNGNITGSVIYIGGYVLFGSDVSYTYDSNYSDKLISFNGQNVGYDSYLNITSIGSTCFMTYQRGNQLLTYKEGLENSTSPYTEYSYNKDGIRYKKVRYVYSNGAYQIVSTSKYQIEDNKIIAETRSGASSLTLYYYYGVSGIEGFLYNGNKYLYLKDGINNIVGILDSSLSLVARYSYDAYGVCTVLNPDGTENTSSTFIGNINPFRYKGYYLDNESNFYYCQTRYYSPEMRRWLTHDDFSYLDEKTIDGLNLYAYSQKELVLFNNERRYSAVGALSIAFSTLKEKIKTLFGTEYRVSAGFESGLNYELNGLIRWGYSNYTTKIEGDKRFLYAFAGTTSDVSNILGTNYYAGVGVNAFGIIGTELYVQTLGVGASIEICMFSLNIDVNLFGMTSITIGLTTDEGNGVFNTSSATFGINTATIIAAIAAIYGLLSGIGYSTPTTIPQYV